MSKTFRDWDPEQHWLLPPSVEELVPEGHLAHFVRETVREELDLSAILSAYDEERGFPPYHPALMTGLLLYGYCTGVYSSRRLARACEERVDFMAVTARQAPDFRTISEFRRRHLVALRGLFAQVVGLCREAGLVRLGHVAIDGTKMRANASKHKAMSYERMGEQERRLEAEVKVWFDSAEAADRAEDRELGEDRRGDEMPEWAKDKQRRREKIREAKAALEAQAKDAAERERASAPPAQAAQAAQAAESAKPSPKAQRNFTDPESRIMKTGDGFVQAYNAQAAVDAESQVIVAQDVVARQNDHEEFVPMIEQAQRNAGSLPQEVSADAGYCSEPNLAACEARGVRAYVAAAREAHGRAKPPIRTRGPLARAMRARLRRGGHRSRYRLRKQTVEPVFGQIKQARGFRRFLMRGLEKVRGEWSLISTAHNLLKLFGAKAAPATA